MTIAQRVGLAVIGLVLLGAAGLLFWMASRAGDLASRSASWPQTIGTVERSGVHDAWVKRGPASVLLYSARVLYTYEANDAPHRSSRIGFSDEYLGTPGDSGRARAEAQAAQWPVGAKVPVFYDPEHPSEAALVPGGGAPFTSRSGVVMAILMGLIGLACFGFALGLRR